MQILTREEFLQTDAGALAKAELQRMASSTDYGTATTYDAMAGRRLSFVNRHLNYLVKHPQVNAKAYLSNLRIMTKSKR